MPSVFTLIIDGQIPCHFVWQDEQAVAFLSINPLAVGHTLVVPRQETDHWLDLDNELTAHLFAIARTIGEAQMAVFAPERIGLIVAGFEVPHTHVHVIPINTMANLDFRNATTTVDHTQLAATATLLRQGLAASR